MCIHITENYACGHQNKQYWSPCPLVAEQRQIPRADKHKAKTCQGPKAKRTERTETLKEKCDGCRKEEKGRRGRSGSWLGVKGDGLLGRLRSRSRSGDEEGGERARAETIEKSGDEEEAGLKATVK